MMTGSRAQLVTGIPHRAYSAFASEQTLCMVFSVSSLIAAKQMFPRQGERYQRPVFCTERTQPCDRLLAQPEGF